MPEINQVTGPARLTGQTNLQPFEARCNQNQSCLVELSGHHKYCSEIRIDCPVKKKAFYKTLEHCGIHRRFADCSFENIEKNGVPKSIREQYGQVRDYVTNLKENVSQGRGLLLKGSVGTMKTTLAAAVLREHITLGGCGLFLTMSGLLDDIFTLKARNLDKWAKFEQQIRKTPLLVLDDLGAEYTKGWVLTKVDAIIAERYNRCCSVIITTNLSAEQMRGIYAERIIDRLRSTLKVVNFSGQSLRQPA